MTSSLVHFPPPPFFLAPEFEDSAAEPKVDLVTATIFLPCPSKSNGPLRFTSGSIERNMTPSLPPSLPPYLPPSLLLLPSCSHHQVIVVLLSDSTNSDDQVQPADLQPADILFPSIGSFLSYDEVNGYIGPGPVAYVTAEFADDLFPADNTFVVGRNDQPDDNYYSNGPLRYGSSFSFFLRSYPSIANANRQFRQSDQQSPRQYEVFSSSSYIINSSEFSICSSISTNISFPFFFFFFARETNPKH